MIFFSVCFISFFSTSHSAVAGLTGQVRTVPGLSKDSSSAAYAQRVEMIDNVCEVLDAMLYAQDGKEKAYQEGRRIFKDYKNGVITVVDTKENQQKVDDYLDQLNDVVTENSHSYYTRPLSKIITIHHADPNNLRNLINQIIQESRAGTSGANGAKTGDYVTGVISAGAGNGLTFLDVTVELITVTGDTTNPSARLYIYTPTRDREVTLTIGNSELVDQYRVRLISANSRNQEAEIEIRLASFSGLQRPAQN